jgi:hypothetical protein
MKTLRAMTAGVLALGVGCSFELPVRGVDGGIEAIPSTRFAAAPVPTSVVSGFVWSPEAFWLALANCGLSCPIPPLTMPGIPLFEGATVAHAQVKLFDPLTGSATLAAPETGTNGVFSMTGVPSRDVPFFPSAVTPPPAAPTDGGVPGLEYLPTLTLRPVSTQWSQCLNISTLQISTTGILDAVAQHQGLTVNDLIDPTKVGGVAVWWLFIPPAGALHVPAGETRMTSSAGTVLHINWAPPGLGPPQQSPLGFFVSGTDTSDLGLAVVLFPPLTGPPSPVSFTPVDPVTDVTQGRPWSFPPLPPMVIPPGTISFGELGGLTPGATGAPPLWLCLP